MSAFMYTLFITNHNTNPIFDVTINMANLPFDYFPLEENLLKSALTKSFIRNVKQSLNLALITAIIIFSFAKVTSLLNCLKQK